MTRCLSRFAVALTMAMFISAPAAGDARFRPEGPELRVAARALWPVVGGLDDAAFLVAWGRGRTVLAQRYDAHSRPLGSRFMLYDGTHDREWPSIAALASRPNGGFVLLLRVADAKGRTYSLHSVVYSAHLELLQESDVAVLTEQPASPGIAVAPDGSFMVVWIANSANGEPLAYARPYDAEAVPRADAIVVTDQQQVARVAAVASGPHGFTVLWRAALDAGFARRFDLFGTALGWPFEVGVWDAACSDAAGNLMLVWRDRNVPSTRLVYGQRLDAKGRPRGTSFQVSETPTVMSSLSVTCDAAGDAVVVWQGWDDDYTRQVFARRYAASGEPDSPEFVAGSSGDPTAAAVVSDAQGNFMVVWTRRYMTGASGRRFRVQPPPEVKGDFDRDGHADLVLRRATDGKVRVWTLHEAARTANLLVWPPPTDLDWTLAGSDDFDRDGRPDLVFRHRVTGGVSFWRLGGPTGVERRGEPLDLLGAPPPPLDWDLAATGDCDGDGHPDLIWQHRITRELEVWRLDGTTWIATVRPVPDRPTDANWQLVAAADFDGDGQRDLLWFNPVSGRVVQWLLDEHLVRKTGRFTWPREAADGGWVVVAAGDYGFGRRGRAGSADLVWRNADSGRLVVWFLDEAGRRTGGTYVTPAAPADALAWNVVGPR